MRPCQQHVASLLSRARGLHTARTLSRPQASKARSFHITAPASLPRKRTFFTSNVYLSQNSDGKDDVQRESPSASESTSPTSSKRKAVRSAGVKNSLRRVAIIAQRPAQRSGDAKSKSASGIEMVEDAPSATQIAAVCVAEAFDMAAVLDILRAHGFAIDPESTGFDASEVVHARGVNGGDIFVFPSGTIVTWSLPTDVVTRQLLSAAEVPLRPEQREEEYLEYVPDPAKDSSYMKGDVVILGTKPEQRDGNLLETTLAKIAFSSGLARSTKLAVLESALTAYFESTRNIPNQLSQGSGVPLGRKFILQKTGQLLSLRARLNHYSELTDSLPDIFWDSRSELGLEGYYEQVGRALDVGVRIRTLNQKMDYAQEIATVLREMSSEQHNTRLEVIIIVLIFVEVLFEMRRIVLEWMLEREEAAEAKRLLAAEGGEAAAAQ